MERTIIAYMLMALLIAGGVALGFYLRRNSRDRVLRRDRARAKFQRDAKATVDNR